MSARLAWAGIGSVAALALALAGALWWTWPEPPPTAPDPFVTLRDPEPPPRPKAPEGARNLVLVIGCTVRADQTTPYGGPPTTTPALMAMAERGARLGDLVTAAPWTRPASTALLTGHHAITVGMADPSPVQDELRLADDVTTLAEHLRDRGWHTVGSTTNPNLNELYGFRQGFDTWRQLARLWRQDGTKQPGSDAVRDALALLDADGVSQDRPFFLFLVLIDAHAPHDATPQELLAQADGGVPGQVVAYRATLRRFDDAVAQLVAGLEQRGFDASDTVVAVANDHGDGLGWPREAGRSHGRYLSPPAVGGVLVVTGPDIPAGTVVPGLASQVDVAPTLASLAGAPGMPTEGTDLSGAILAGTPTGEARVFSDTWFQDVDRAAVYTPDRACQHDFGDPDAPHFPTACFDRASDPAFAHPLPAGDALEELLQWRAERAGVPTVPARDDPEVRRQLRDLGYVDPDPDPG
ncbi:MAG: sulfatase-like hydrolase/transferase [Alphaproteobacteria bacterium]|nr:sulfatase-like hydrolase/transferase [Alphaproteobacteria bacterium]MCB9697845.1 sulfatase-like hydrolase/transferase [Alphaproteobacteria bacterium]